MRAAEAAGRSRSMVAKGSEAVKKALAAIPGLEVEPGAPLAPLTTLRIGGPAELLVTVNTQRSLMALLRLVRERGVPLHLLGMGSNVLYPDRGVAGVVARLGGVFARTRLLGDRLRAGGAVPLPKLARSTAAHGLTGLEAFSGFPSSVGGAVVMNAGCYGTEIKDVLVSVTAIDRDGRRRRYRPPDLEAGYRRTVLQGTGAVVASGTFQIGVADSNLLMRWRDQNPAAPVKPVFIVYNRAPYAIIARKSRGFAVPKDLEGKRLGAPTGSASSAQWPLFAHLNGIDPAKVKIESVGIPVRDPMLAAGQIDAITAFAFRSYIDLKDRGVPVNDLVVWRMMDYGLQVYGNAIIVNDKFATENPQAVAGFLAAFLRGLRDTVADPAAAVASVVRRNEVARREVELERLRMALRENILTPEVRANGFGGVDAARLQTAIDQQALIFKFKAKPTPAQAFDASFLPPAEERKLN